ncbi:MAG: alpha/beta fold hydrolase [Blastococcus sp.]
MPDGTARPVDPGELLVVPVAGGELAVEVLPGTTEPVLAVHGLSSNRRLWNWLRAEAPEISLIAPDLRGRGGSVSAGGPSSLARHAADLVAVLDALGLERVRVCGMSMGAFVAVVLAVAHPDRVRDLVLVDGGFPMAVAEGLTADQVRATFAAQAGRAGRMFADVPDYAAYFLQGAPLLDPADPLLQDYLAHDLRDGRVRLDPEVMAADAVDTLLGSSPWRQLTRPARLLYAEWSVGADSLPAYTPERVAGLAAELPALRSTELVRGVDHAASIMTGRGAAAVARSLREPPGFD